MPSSQLDTNDDSGESNTVVEARAIIGWLRVDAYKKKDDKSVEKDVLHHIIMDPGVETISKSALDDGDKPTKQSTDNHVEEAVHATIYPADEDG